MHFETAALKLMHLGALATIWILPASGCSTVHEGQVRVVDAVSGRPIPEADVVVERRSAYFLDPFRARSQFPSVQKGKTDPSGVLAIRLIDDDSFVFHASHIGYQDAEMLLAPWKTTGGDFIIAMPLQPKADANDQE